MARKATTTKVCTKCGGTFAHDEFYKDKSQKDGRSPWCKACERAYNKAYRAGLKAADATAKARIVDDKGIKLFERAMKDERVVRGAKKVAPAKVAPATTRRKRTTRANVARDVDAGMTTGAHDAAESVVA